MSEPSDDRGETGQIHREQGLLTMTMLARWAETSAYTPPEEPTTGAVMSATDTAKEPGRESGNHQEGGSHWAAQPWPLLSATRAEATPQQEAPSFPFDATLSGGFFWDCPEDLCMEE